MDSAPFALSFCFVGVPSALALWHSISLRPLPECTLCPLYQCSSSMPIWLMQSSRRAFWDPA
eukprot:8333108-Alexandrium_andersonii.AAC.1